MIKIYLNNKIKYEQAIEFITRYICMVQLQLGKKNTRSRDKSSQPVGTLRHARKRKYEINATYGFRVVFVP